MAIKKKTRKKMLMNYYDDSTYEMCKKTSRTAAFKWLAEANRFFYKSCPRKIWKLRMRAREMGW